MNTTLVNTLNDMIGRIQQELTQHSNDGFDFVHRRLDELTRQMLRLATIGNVADNVICEIHNVLNTLECLDVNEIPGQNNRFCIGTVVSGRKGRPKYSITLEQLTYLFQNGFTAVEIANMLGVSLRTIRRRMEQYVLKSKSLYTNLTDLEVDAKVREICHYFPNIGYRRLMGELSRQGIRLTRTKVRESLHRVDPLGIIERWLHGPVYRREYFVPGPQELWHIDGNHKLIR